MTVAFRHRRRSDDPFFAEGDKVSFGNQFGSSAIFLIQTDYNLDDDKNDVMTNNEKSYDKEESQICNSAELFCYPCCSPGCPEVFDSMEECENHYEKFHTKQCNVCMKTFPTDHLLDLHLQECHDSYFAVAIESQRARHQCLVHTCKETFRNDAERLIHLRQIHNYPKWFRFHPRADKLLSQNRSMKNKLKLKKEKSTVKSKLDQTTIQKMDVTKTNDSDNICQQAKKAARKTRQKENRAKIPCKFFLSSYCRHGNKCMFLHDYEARKKSITDPIEMITEKLNDAKVSVPENLSFGRRKTRSILSVRQS